MITNEEKLECVKWAKSLSVKHRKYESAASLRDEEKHIAKLMQLENYDVSYPPDLKLEPLPKGNALPTPTGILALVAHFNQNQLRYVQQLLERHFGLEELQLITEIIQLRRSNNINTLLD